MTDDLDLRAGADGRRKQNLRLLDTPESVVPVAGLGDVQITPGTIAFVPPRFGDGVVGGAEAVLAEAARGLARRGHPVEILTTCARDHFTWANEFRPGVSVDEGVVVRRFRTELDPASGVRDEIGNRILGCEDVSIQDQQRWMNASLRSSSLWHHVFDHGEHYRAFVFAPYMFWTTYAVSQIHSRRSIIMPCLHDEAPARLELFRTMIEGAGGVWFLTEPERELASRLYKVPKQAATVGASVDVPPTYDAERFRATLRDEHGIDGPFAYFAGRREWGKGWPDLLDGFASYARQERSRPNVPGRRQSLHLVTSGVGQVTAPPGMESLITDLGLISDEDRNDAMAAASVYLQPSAMESFSRTVLESMLAGTPVVANDKSDVVRWHLERSGAGLTYRNSPELVECLKFVTDEPRAASQLANGGREYVKKNYLLDGVLDRMEESLEQWLPAARPKLVGGSTR